MKKLKDFNINVSDKRFKEIEKSYEQSKKLEKIIKVRAISVFRKRYHFDYRLLLCSILTCLLCFSFLFSSQFVALFNFKDNSFNFDESNFYVHFIDVGQGKAIAIRSLDNQTYLIDCGSQAYEQQLHSYLQQYFFKNSNSTNTFDHFIITHLDEDHAGNASFIFKNYNIKNFYRPKILTTQETLKFDLLDKIVVDDGIINTNIAKDLEKENCSVIYNFEGVKITSPSTILSFLSPSQDNFSDSNSYSPIMLFTQFISSAQTNNQLIINNNNINNTNNINNKNYISRSSNNTYLNNNNSFNVGNSNDIKQYKFLFTGDATASIEEEVVVKYSNILKCDVLDVSHHGSSLSTTDEFLEYCRPKFAVFSLSSNNIYGFPSNDVIDRLIKCGVDKQNMLMTSSGNIIFSLDKNNNLQSSFIQKTNLNYSNYSYLQIFVSFECVIFIVCFTFQIPSRPRIY